MFYIQTTGARGDAVLWWRPERCGYTTVLDEAGLYAEAEARAIERGRPGEDTAWPQELVERATTRVVFASTLLAMRGEGSAA